MSDNHAYCSVVESIVCLHVEERFLQDARREANLVGCRVIVCVHCLWCHEPLFVVDWFSRFLFIGKLIPENATVLYIFKI